jgi:hypothetical protein
MQTNERILEMNERLSTCQFLKKMNSHVDPDLKILKNIWSMKKELIDNVIKINSIFTKFGKIIDVDDIKIMDDELIIYIYIIVGYIINLKKILFARRVTEQDYENPILFLPELKKDYKTNEIYNLHSIIVYYHAKKTNQVTEIANNFDVDISCLLTETDLKKFKELDKKNKMAIARNKRKKIKGILLQLKQESYKQSFYNKELAMQLYDQKLKNFMEKQKEENKEDEIDDMQYNDEFNIEESAGSSAATEEWAEPTNVEEPKSFEELDESQQQNKPKKTSYFVLDTKAIVKQPKMEETKKSSISVEDDEKLFEIEREKQKLIEIDQEEIYQRSLKFIEISDQKDEDIPDAWDMSDNDEAEKFIPIRKESEDRPRIASARK